MLIVAGSLALASAWGGVIWGVMLILKEPKCGNENACEARIQREASAKLIRARDDEIVKAEASRARTRASEELDLYRAQRTITAALRDPSSAQFGRVFPGRVATVCGFVNARNGFGGYTGMQPFIVSGSDAVMVTELKPETLAAWKQFCV